MCVCVCVSALASYFPGKVGRERIESVTCALEGLRICFTTGLLLVYYCLTYKAVRAGKHRVRDVCLGGLENLR